MRIRVAGIIPIGDGFAFMHRVGVQNHPIGDYYTFPGGGKEEGETLEEGTRREIQEEFGINVEVEKQIYCLKNEEKEEYFFLCKYIDGKFGTGKGPEFSVDPKYAHRGQYLPEIIKKEDVKNITLLPNEIKEKLVQDIERGRI
jgi:8-oxo-dGTP diphosphatase